MTGPRRSGPPVPEYEVEGKGINLIVTSFLHQNA
jgi:hypothetical protein